MGVCLEDVVKREKSLQDGNLQIKFQNAKGFLIEMEVAEEKAIPLPEQKSIRKLNSLQH